VEDLGTVSSWFEVFNLVRDINKNREIWWVAPVSLSFHKAKKWDTITVGVFLEQYRTLNSSLYQGEEYQIFRKDEHTLIVVYIKKGEKI